ncbi:MAG: exopolysaccharide biosynthesis protein [Alphaproteobacteria bacterium]|nr:exopolysaccharide biosynthesis protein [Alphaproteobacteria bacterium]
MKSHELLAALERLFAGPRDALLTVNALLAGLETRSYAFAIAVLDLPNCVPTGLPLLSTVTGIPMLLFVAQGMLRRPAPSLPSFLGTLGLPKGRLQDLLQHLHKPLNWLEDKVHPRHEFWVTGLARRALLTACVVMIVILALPIPFDNFFAAWAIMFFCLALMEDDGVMAMLGWLLTTVTLAWTALLLIVGPWVVFGLVKSLL